MTSVEEPVEHLDNSARPAEIGTAKRTTRYVTVAVVALGVILGLMLPSYSSLVFLVVIVVIALPLVNARPAVWVALALIIPWTSRLLTTTGLAPRALDFLDFPIVLIAFVVAGIEFLGSKRALQPSTRRILGAVLVSVAVIAISWGFQDRAEPARLVAALVLALEPFLLLIAIVLMPMTDRERKALTYITLGLLCVQLLFSGIDIVVFGEVSDDVKGTLLESGAGHHVSAGGLALAVFLLVGLRARTPVIVAFGVLALTVTIVADAKQVLFVLPLAALVLGIAQTNRRSILSVVVGIVVGALMAGAAGYAIYSYQASDTALQFIDQTNADDTGKQAVLPALWTDISASPDKLVFGLGPGESVSRFAFLTTASLIKAGSPVTILGLHVSRGADKYNDVAFAGKFQNQSSFTSAQSSALGVLGDYGLAGVAAFGLMIAMVLRAIMRSPHRGMRAAALASWVLLLPLAVVFDWLEQPPFTLAVVMISGLAIRTPAAPGLTPIIFRRSRSSQTDSDSVAPNGAGGQKVVQYAPL